MSVARTSKAKSVDTAGQVITFIAMVVSVLFFLATIAGYDTLNDGQRFGYISISMFLAGITIWWKHRTNRGAFLVAMYVMCLSLYLAGSLLP